MRQQAGESGARMGFGGPGHLPTVGSEGLPGPSLLSSSLVSSSLICLSLSAGSWASVSGSGSPSLSSQSLQQVWIRR